MSEMFVCFLSNRDPLESGRCERCGKPIWQGRRFSKWCSNACKQAAYRGRLSQPSPDASGEPRPE